MGGATVYLDGVIFAIVAEDIVWFKADATSDAVWDEAGCPRFTSTMGEGRVGSINYRRAPDDCHDDADAMREWARLGVEADACAGEEEAGYKMTVTPAQAGVLRD